MKHIDPPRPTTYPVDPVVLLLVSHTPVQGVGSEHDDEVLGRLDRLQQTFVKLPCSQPLDVDEDGEASQLEVDFE